MTAYNGNEITYDEIGNPLTYYNGMKFSWTMGRRLKSVKNGNANISYAYNADGLRTRKVISGIQFNYYWNGDKLTGQTWHGNTLYFYYDKDGNPIGFDYNNNHYYYITNLQGDIIAILDVNGNLMAEYEYDSWGNCTITYDTNSIAYTNPLRYRGYYYDSDTGLYYLQSRYYDANIGRFINADDAEMIYFGVRNLFSYCKNNPVINIDKTGKIGIIQASILSGFLYVGTRFVDNLLLSFYLYGLSASVAKTTQYVFNLNKTSPAIVSVMTNRFKNSKKVANRIKNYAKKAKKGTYTKKENIDFYGPTCAADRDLLYSIGAVSSFVLQVKYKSENKKVKNYEVSIAVIDKYDFDKFKKGEKATITRLVNNYGGYFPMKIGVISMYYWSAYCKFSYSIKK